jgi:hypothetical protein
MSSLYVPPEGDSSMAIETKVILVALSKIVSKSRNVKEVYKALAEIANVGGVVLKTFEEAQAEAEDDE